jgi:hypothetical protein
MNTRAIAWRAGCAVVTLLLSLIQNLPAIKEPIGKARMLAAPVELVEEMVVPSDLGIPQSQACALKELIVDTVAKLPRKIEERNMFDAR